MLNLLIQAAFFLLPLLVVGALAAWLVAEADWLKRKGK